MLLCESVVQIVGTRLCCWWEMPNGRQGQTRLLHIQTGVGVQVDVCRRVSQPRHSMARILDVFNAGLGSRLLVVGTWGNFLRLGTFGMLCDWSCRIAARARPSHRESRRVLRQGAFLSSWIQAAKRVDKRCRSHDCCLDSRQVNQPPEDTGAISCGGHIDVVCCVGDGRAQLPGRGRRRCRVSRQALGVQVCVCHRVSQPRYSMAKMPLSTNGSLGSPPVVMTTRSGNSFFRLGTCGVSCS